MQGTTETGRYLKSCATDFWHRVFDAELAYLLKHLKTEDRILSVGCGPAIIERSLAEMGFQVTGLDVSQEALACAGDSLRTVLASAEEMPFDDNSFDVAIFVASLQFVNDYNEVLKRSSSVLRPGGRIIAMLLNPASSFFKERYANTESYVRKLKHIDLSTIEEAAKGWFETTGEYFLGIDGERLFESSEPSESALYLLKGVKL